MYFWAAPFDAVVVVVEAGAAAPDPHGDDGAGVASLAEAASAGVAVVAVLSVVAAAAAGDSSDAGSSAGVEALGGATVRSLMQ